MRERWQRTRTGGVRGAMAAGKVVVLGMPMVGTCGAHPTMLRCPSHDGRRVGTRLCPPFSDHARAMAKDAQRRCAWCMAAGQVVVLLRCADGGHLRCTPCDAWVGWAHVCAHRFRSCAGDGEGRAAAVCVVQRPQREWRRRCGVETVGTCGAHPTRSAVPTLRGMGRVGTRLCPPFSIMRGCWGGTGSGGVRDAMAAG